MENGHVYWRLIIYQWAMFRSKLLNYRTAIYKLILGMVLACFPIGFTMVYHTNFLSHHSMHGVVGGLVHGLAVLQCIYIYI